MMKSIANDSEVQGILRGFRLAGVPVESTPDDTTFIVKNPKGRIVYQALRFQSVGPWTVYTRRGPWEMFTS